MLNIRVMLHLRLKNPVPDQLAHRAPFPHLNPEFPLKPRIERKSARPFQIVSLPQQDGSFVASVVEAPEILVYDARAKRRKTRLPKGF